MFYQVHLFSKMSTERTHICVYLQYSGSFADVQNRLKADNFPVISLTPLPSSLQFVCRLAGPHTYTHTHTLHMLAGCEVEPLLTENVSYEKMKQETGRRACGGEGGLQNCLHYLIYAHFIESPRDDGLDILPWSLLCSVPQARYKTSMIIGVCGEFWNRV